MLVKSTLLLFICSVIIVFFAVGCCCGGRGYEEWEAEWSSEFDDCSEEECPDGVCPDEAEVSDDD